MVRRAPDGQEGPGSGGEAAGSEGVATTGLPPFAEVFVPQFEEIESVLERLPGFALLPIEVPSRDVAWALGQWLALSKHPVQLVFRDADWRVLTAAIVASAPEEGGIVMVTQPSDAARDTLEKGLRLLNQRRDTVATRLKVPLLWCGSREFLRRTGELAPDFWSVREVPLRVEVPAEYESLATTANIHFEDLLSRHIDSDDKTSLELGLLSSAEASRAQRRTEDAEAQLREAITLLGQAGKSHEVVRATIALSDVLRRTGRAAESEALLKSVLRLAAEVDDWGQQADVLVNLAIVQIDLRQPLSALESLDRARSRLDQVGDDESLASMHAVRAKALEQTADLDGAARAMTQATELFERTGNRLRTIAALVISADIHLATGDSELALRSLRRAFSLVSQKGEALVLTRLLVLTRRLPDSVAGERDALIAEMDTRLGALSR